MRVFAIVFALLSSVAVAPEASAAPYQAAASSWIIIDGHTGDVQAAFNPDEQLYPASLTKMLTAIVVSDRARLGETFTISRTAATAPADHLHWPQGATFTVEQVMHGMLLESSNGAAIALAEHVAGSESAFTALMNDRARFLGVLHSYWTTPEGLDANGQRATARDLAVIARSFMAHPILARIARTTSYEVPWQGGHLTFHARNAFLKSYKGAIGIKPGYTTLASNCLAAAAVRNGRTLIVVVMRSPSAVADAIRLLDEAFARRPVVQRSRGFHLAVFPPPSDPEPEAPVRLPSLTVLPRGLSRGSSPLGPAYAALSAIVTLGVLAPAARRRRTLDHAE